MTEIHNPFVEHQRASLDNTIQATHHHMIMNMLEYLPFPPNKPTCSSNHTGQSTQFYMQFWAYRGT